MPTTSHREPFTGTALLTTVLVGLLGVVATAGATACLVYAVWWLASSWAPT